MILWLTLYSFHCVRFLNFICLAGSKNYIKKYVLFKIGLLPDSPRILFLFSSSIHWCYTRHCNSFYIPHCRANIGQFTFCFQGPRFLNSLNIGIQNVGTLPLYKSKLLTLFLSWLPSCFFFLFNRAVLLDVYLSACYCCCFMWCSLCSFPFNLQYFYLNYALITHVCKILGACST